MLRRPPRSTLFPYTTLFRSAPGSDRCLADAPMDAWDAVRSFALGLPNATEDFPWGEAVVKVEKRDAEPPAWRRHLVHGPDRKSTRLNSSHLGISYAVFCLKK